MEQKFYICETCGNIVAYVKNSGVPVFCCGKKMQEIIPGTSDASTEKHVPVIVVDGNKVTVSVGSIEHPMVKEHYIEWISIETKDGNQRKVLAPENAPMAEFMITDTDEVKAAYAYCNLHSLWKTEK